MNHKIQEVYIGVHYGLLVNYKVESLVPPQLDRSARQFRPWSAQDGTQLNMV